ncbi:hypothetical protein ACHAXA_006538, partial [Cyclostephanos tholiformis]
DFHSDPFHNDAFPDGGGGHQHQQGDGGRRLENFMQRKQQRLHRPQAQQDSGPLLSPSGMSQDGMSQDGMSYVSRMKHNNYANVWQQEIKPQPPPTRVGRSLYKDPEDSHASRSRSTIRRIADRTVKLSQTMASSSGDAVDDCDSVISFGCHSIGGEGYAGFPLQQQQRRSSSSKLARSLDSFVASHSGHDVQGNNNDDNFSVISGAGSVAARRRAARHQQMTGKGQHSPQQPLHCDDRGIGDVYGNGVNYAPSPSSSWQHPRNNVRSPPRKQILLTPITDISVDREVNMALSELKLSHADIIDVNFISEAFGRMDSGSGSTASPHGSFDSSAGTAASLSLNNSMGGIDGGSLSLKSVLRPSAVGKAAAEPKKMTASGGGVGGGGRTSPHTVSTRSMTIANSSVVVDHPATTSAAVAATAVEAVGDVSISPMISVDNHSESSSLTDDVGSDSWQLINSNNNRSGNIGGSNIFKDAERMGSTFHKSKKIVRLDDSVPVASSSGGESAVVASKIPSARPSLPVKNGRNSISRQHDLATNPLPSTEKVGSNCANPYAVKLRKTAQLPQTPTSSNISSSSSVEKKILNSTIDGSITTTVTTSCINASGFQQSRLQYGKEISVRNDKVNHDEGMPKNPFLAQIKLRKTSGAKFNSGESPQLEDPQVGAAVTAKELHPQELKRDINKKLTYREQQELLRQQRQELEEENDKSKLKAPTRDVAAIIRERIAASKSNSLTRLNCGSGGDFTPSSTDQRNGNVSNASDSASASMKSGSVIQKYKNTNDDEGTTYIPMKRQIAAIASVHDEAKETVASVNSSSSECEENVDPRAALMALLKKRGDPDHAATPLARRAPIPSMDNENKQEPPPDPRNALSAMLAKRGDSKGPSPTHVLSDKKCTPQRGSSTMIAQRPPQQSSHSNNVSHHANTGAYGNGGSDNAGRPAIKNDPIYEKYFKMLKMGMPLPAVQHAMTRDGLDPSVMDGDHNMPAPLPKSLGGVPLKDDPAYAKYFKMIKLGLPMGAVKNAMERDGVNSSVMDGDHNAPVQIAGFSKSSSSIENKQKDTHRRTRLHWDALEDTEVNSDSVWALVEEDVELNQIEIDEKEFTKLFQAEITSNSASGCISGSAVGCGGSGGSSRNVVQVIDPKRANNGGIILARLRMSYDDMARAVDAIDETAMQANQAQGIIEYMPTQNERKSLREYMKNSNKGNAVATSFDRLCECEKFMVAMMTVKQSKRKIRALLFKLQFRGCIHDLAHDVFSIEKACDEISNSVRLRKLFGIVLNIGNRLNTAGPGQKRKAGAFSIKSLLKLNQAKAFDNKTTFLHYVVLVVQRNSEALLSFKDDLPTVFKAEKIYWDQCVSELEEVETQLENVRKLALYEAKSNKIKYQLPTKAKSSDADNDSDDISVDSMSLEDEVSLLRSTKIGMFALSAIRKVSQLRERVDTAKDKFASLLKYLGENSDSRMQPHELFEIITTFCRTFDVARADVEKMEKAKKRDEKKEKLSESGTKNERLKAIQENPATNKTSLFPRASSHQSNMSSVISDIKRVTTSMYSSSVASSSPAQLGHDNGPPKVTNRYPDDESSLVNIDIQRKRSLHFSLSSTHETPEFKPAQEPDVPPRVQQESKEVEDELLATDSDAVVVDQRMPQAGANAQEGNKLEMLHRAEEVAATKKAARITLQLQAENEAAAENAAQLAKQQQAEEAAISHNFARKAVEQREQAEEEDKHEIANNGVRTTMQQREQAEEKVAVEAAIVEACLSDQSYQRGPNPDPKPKKQTPLTRREILTSRRMIARNRHVSQTTQTKELSSEVAPAHLPVPPSTTQPAITTEEQSTPPREESKNSTMARDRYARHKKLLQQRGR